MADDWIQSQTLVSTILNLVKGAYFNQMMIVSSSRSPYNFQEAVCSIELVNDLSHKRNYIQANGGIFFHFLSPSIKTFNKVLLGVIIHTQQ
jgi:hypothetical protein